MKKVSIVLGQQSDMEQRERILVEAEDLFCKFGVKRITMDDIARDLGMSKKTIYQHFKDKNELVFASIKNLLEELRKNIELNRVKASNAVEEAFAIVTHLQSMLSKINPMIFYDIQKYHGEVWSLFKDFRYAYMKGCLLNNLKWGVAEGYFRKELNQEIISELRLEQVDMIFNQLVFTPGRFLITDVMTEVSEHFLYGLCTIKGHHLINKYRKITEE